MLKSSSFLFFRNNFCLKLVIHKVFTYYLGSFFGYCNFCDFIKFQKTGSQVTILYRCALQERGYDAKDLSISL